MDFQAGDVVETKARDCRGTVLEVRDSQPMGHDPVTDEEITGGPVIIVSCVDTRGEEYTAEFRPHALRKLDPTT